MRVLVTGGAGFIGHHLVGRLLTDGDAVVVLDNLSRGSFARPELAGAKCIRGDIREPGACAEAVAGCDAVVHLAAVSNVMGSQSDPALTISTNVDGTKNVAQAAARASVPHLVFASSREVYGEPDHLPVRESEPLCGKNAYGASKVAAEQFLQDMDGDVSVSILRFTNVIGSGDSGRVVPLWIAAAREGRPLVVYGGRQIIDFVPVSTAVEAVVRVLRRGGVDKPVNVGSGKQTTLFDLASVIRRSARLETRIDVRPTRAIEVTRFQADVTRMHCLLGITPAANPLSTVAELVGGTA